MNPIKDLQKINYFTIILYLNIGVFILIALLNNWIWLTKANQINLIQSLIITSDIDQLIQKPWTFITHMFTHENNYQGLVHLLTNMVVFYFSGKIFTTYLTQLKLLTTYLIGGICGAFAYVIAYNSFEIYTTPALGTGASAAVIAILTAITTYMPNFPAIGKIKLKHVTTIIILYFIVSIPVINSGGHIAHLGGALYGFLSIILYKKNINTGWLLEKIISLFKVNNNKVKKKRTENDYEYNARKKKENEKIDKILDKISKSGYDSLSNKEKDDLFKHK
tara:strand:- start:2016 stop:2849 length:834 start_codon:yes stop_codon:yes gene_type:complete